MTSGTAPHRTWQQRAACADMDPDLWFPDGDRGGRTLTQRQALALALQTCATCPVRDECAEAGRDERYGIWGGLTPADRERAAGKLPPLRRRGPEPGVAQPRRQPGQRGRGRTHGRRGTYTDGCRCGECCAAERSYQRQYRAARRAIAGSPQASGGTVDHMTNEEDAA